MWFKVDDGLHAHRKARAVRRSHPLKTRDVAPFGLWVLAGSWCGNHPTGGFVPAEILEDWDTDAPELARRLVDAGLWWETEQDGEPGYGFHDWQDYIPRPGGVEDPSESGRRGNHVRWHVGREQVDEDCEFCFPDRGDVAPDIAPISPPDIAPESGTDRNPVPTRPEPDPTRPEPKTRKRAPETALPETWKPKGRHAKYAEENGLNLSSEVMRFRNHAMANDRRLRQWDAGFDNWLIKGQEFRPKVAPARHPDMGEAYR